MHHTSQPTYAAQIDWDNPICRNLIIATQKIGSDLVNIINGEIAVSTGDTYPQDVISPYGEGFSFTSSYFTFSRQKVNAGTASHTILMLQKDRGADNTTFRVYSSLFVDVNTEFTFYLYAGTIYLWSGVTFYNLGFTPVMGETKLIGYVYNVDGASSTGTGIYGGTIYSPVTLPSTMAENVPITLNSYDNTAYATTDTLLFLVFNRSLSNFEIKSLNDNPWQIFKEPTGNLYNYSSSTSDIILALSGLAVTSSNGSLSSSRNISIIGFSITSSQGTLLASLLYSLTGQAVTEATGSILANLTGILTGQSFVSNQGSVLANNNIGLSGLLINNNNGSLSVDRQTSLTGQAIIDSQGLLIAVMDKSLSGQLSTLSSGTLISTINKTLSGQSITIQQGLLTVNSIIPIAGSSITLAQGIVNPVINSQIVLVGWEMQSGYGVLTSNIDTAISGLQSTITKGLLNPATINLLSGSEFNAQKGQLQSISSIFLTGNNITASQGQTIPILSVPLTGQLITASEGTLTVNIQNNISVPLTGQALSVISGAFIPTIDKSINGLGLALDVGTLLPLIAKELALIGQQTNLSVGNLSLTLNVNLNGNSITIALGGVNVYNPHDIGNNIIPLESKYFIKNLIYIRSITIVNDNLIINEQ